jgi:hypothetical protein
LNLSVQNKILIERKQFGLPILEASNLKHEKYENKQKDQIKKIITTSKPHSKLVYNCPSFFTIKSTSK